MPEKIDTSTESVQHQARSNFFSTLILKTLCLEHKLILKPPHT